MLRTRPVSVLPLLLALLSATCKSAPRAPAPPAQLEIGDLFELSAQLSLKTSKLGWTPDGSAWLTVDGGKITAVDVASGARRVFLDPAAMEKACAELPGVEKETAKAWAARTDFNWAADRSGVLINDEHDLFFYSLTSGKAARLTQDARDEVGETLSPDGKLAGFVADWNLFVVPTDGSSAPRALTTAGDENHLHGRLDWIYQEEVYGRGNFGAFWWSPDSRRIAFLILDETKVPTYVVTDHRGVEPTFESWRYPKAGDPNPVVALAVVDVESGLSHPVDLSPWTSEEPLIVRVSWKPDASSLFFQIQDRLQTRLDLVQVDPTNGASHMLFRDRTQVWIEPCDGPIWIDDERFLWRSERDGWAHLYLYQADGTLLGRLTEGPWEVDAFDHYDPDTGWAYFLADKDDVKGEQLYRCKLDGSALERITSAGGTHSVSFAPGGKTQGGKLFLDTRSSLVEWPSLSLCTADGKVVREIERVDGAPATAKGVILPEFLHPVTRDGFEMEAMLFQPKGFNPTNRRPSEHKYPVVCFVYSGPHAPKVRDVPLGFDGLYHSMLAQRGYLVWICDNRSASGKGLDSVKRIYRDFGSLELEDLSDGLDWLIAKGYADPKRVGIWGWSYGGYQTAFALTHSERFKLGISGAPVTDWRLYDSIYTERYMDLPLANAKGYGRSSVLEAAANLSGKLLLIHGVIDENVHLQNSLNLAEKLQLAGIPFQLMLYPGNRHPVVDPAQKRHLYSMMAQFIYDNL